MKKSVYSVIGALTVLVVGSAEAAQVQADPVRQLDKVKVGVYYSLTPLIAAALNISMADLQREMKVQANEKILFKVQENGELNLSIYDDASFRMMRADGVIK